MTKTLLPRDVFFLEHFQEPKEHRSGYLPGLSVAVIEEWGRESEGIPTDRNLHYLARELSWLGRPKSAIKLFEKHVAMNGWAAERAESFAFMGDCYGQIGDAEKQVESYHKCFHADPTRRVGLLRLAHYYKSINEPHACAAFASAAMEIPYHPFYAANMREFNALPFELRYWARGWQGNVAGAQQDILQVLAMEPDNAEANRDMAFYFEYDVNTAPEGWMIANELIWLHDNAKGKKRILEVGSWKGRSTHALCTGAAKTGGAVYAVDHFGGSSEEGDYTHGADPEETYNAFRENTKQFSSLVVHRADSLEAAKEYPDGFFDMIFIDGTHDFENVRADILAWAPKCRGLLSGHDFSPTWPNVQAAVRSAIGEPDGVDCSIWHKKIGAPQVNPLLLYLTKMVVEGKPVSFVKLGDGEQACMDGEVGANCDGHPYSQELGWKLRMAFAELNKMSAPLEGRTWVNVVPFKDQAFYNILLHRTDSDFDSVKDFWGAVRQSDAVKVFVGPARLKPVADMLRAEFVEIPLVNAFSVHSEIRDQLRWKAKPGTIFVFCAGMPAKLWIANVLSVQHKVSCIDAGSAWDPMFVEGGTRTMQLQKWLLEQEYKEWMG